MNIIVNTKINHGNAARPIARSLYSIQIWIFI